MLHCNGRSVPEHPTCCIAMTGQCLHTSIAMAGQCLHTTCCIAMAGQCLHTPRAALQWQVSACTHHVLHCNGRSVPAHTTCCIAMAGQCLHTPRAALQWQVSACTHHVPNCNLQCTHTCTYKSIVDNYSKKKYVCIYMFLNER